jgi:YHS domain-containing protein
MIAMQRRTVLLAAFALAMPSIARPSAAGEPVNSTFFGTAIKGFDPVAYFTEGRPVEGSRRFSYDWNGATWRFASALNRDLFIADPEAYAPQYGGYCAWAVAEGYTADIDPEAWHIANGRLYLNYNQTIKERWLEDVTGHIAEGDANWPEILAELAGSS